MSGARYEDENAVASPDPVQLLGECHPLLEQLGSADGLFTLNGAAGALSLPVIENALAFSQFLEVYCSHVLLPLELPAICRAHHHSSRNEIRELLALDLELAAGSKYEDFASASRRVGGTQLQRLRPLRDVRLVQRYLNAVESGEAQGWHTIVYGLTLAVYALPVRQGLLVYARQTLNGFIQAAAQPLGLSASGCNGFLQDACDGLPAKVESILAATLTKLK